MSSTEESKGTVVNLPFRPTKPKMGGLIQTGREDWTPWVGGKPKSDWTALAESSPMFIDPRQYRPTSAGSAQKSKAYRMVPVEPKLSKGSNLLDFLKNFQKRLETHGLDTVTYLPDPENPQEVLSVLTHHSRYTRDKATEKALEYFAPPGKQERIMPEIAEHILGYAFGHVRECDKPARKKQKLN